MVPPPSGGERSAPSVALRSDEVLKGLLSGAQWGLQPEQYATPVTTDSRDAFQVGATNRLGWCRSRLSGGF